MKISFADIILSTLATSFCILIGLFASFLIHQVIYLPHGFQAIFLIFTFCFSFILGTFLLVSLIRNFCLFHTGTFILDNHFFSLGWKLLNYIYIVHLWPLFNASLVPINMRAFAYSLLGARIESCVMIGGKLIEPHLITIGKNSILGEDSLLTAHAIQNNKLELGEIILGSQVTVGVKAVILPDVIIGDRATVAVGAVVKKGTRIGPDEVWAGIPATRIK